MKEVESEVYIHGWAREVKLSNDKGAEEVLPLTIMDTKYSTPFERWLIENYKSLPEYPRLFAKFKETAQLYNEATNNEYSPVKVILNERDIA